MKYINRLLVCLYTVHSLLSPPQGTFDLERSRGGLKERGANKRNGLNFFLENFQ